eukprot:1638798-Pleurochrysis_carterae.AAC.3
MHKHGAAVVSEFRPRPQKQHTGDPPSDSSLTYLRINLAILHGGASAPTRGAVAEAAVALWPGADTGGPPVTQAIACAVRHVILLRTVPLNYGSRFFMPSRAP